MTKPAEIEQQPFKLEEPLKHEHKMEFGLIELLQTRMEDEVKGVESGISDLLPADPTDDEIAEAELRDAALDRVAAALVKLGISEDDLNLAFGIEPASVRKAKKPKRDKNVPPGQAKKVK